ncbi:MAG: LPS assembly lipoprotein LptE [Alphaproteobacteria bacterium]
MRPNSVLVFGALMSAMMLSACGFRPLYGETEDRKGLGDRLATVEVEEVKGPNDREFETALNTQMYPSGRPADVETRYMLQVRLKADREGLAIQPDASITRYDYHLVGRYRLLDVSTGKAVHDGVATARTAWNVVDSQFATLAARRDAEDRAIRTLSEEIRMRIALFLATGAAPEGTEPRIKN